MNFTNISDDASLQAVCSRMGIETGDRLSLDARKRKFLVISMPDDLVRLVVFVGLLHARVCGCGLFT